MFNNADYNIQAICVSSGDFDNLSVGRIYRFKRLWNGASDTFEYSTLIPTTSPLGPYDSNLRIVEERFFEMFREIP